MDVGRLDILGEIVQNRVIDPQWLEDVVVEVMVVTKMAEVMGKLEPLHHNMVGAMDRQTIGPIVTLSLGCLKRRHLMLSSRYSS